MHLIAEEDCILQSFRPRLRGTNLKLARVMGVKIRISNKQVSVPDYGELILNFSSLLFLLTPYISSSFRPRLRGTNLKLLKLLSLHLLIIESFRPRLRGTNLKLL